MNADISSFSVISAGVPQGSILEPLLFSIYTADFRKFLQHSRSHKCADDTQIHYPFSPAVAHINADLKSVSDLSLARTIYCFN